MEAALLDIKGKVLGVPVYELLGGNHPVMNAMTLQLAATIPNAPALELDEEACARHPCIRHPIRQFDPDRGANRPEGAVPFVTAKSG